jgi:glycosyltransferase involved in cell wall biosynthesis
LDSVLCQTETADQVFVVSHDSTDDTQAILNLYILRITVIQKENTSLSSARNGQYTHAQRDLIAFINPY